MKRNSISVLLFLLAALAIQPVVGQNILTNSTAPRLKVFIDGCGGGGGPGRRGNGCDMNFLRTEITAVDFFRDNETADVFLLINDNRAGNGGTQFQMIFYGQQGVHRGKVDTLYVSTLQTDTDFEVREKVTRYIKLGLAPFVAKTKAAADIDIDMNTAASADSAEEEEEEQIEDPWNFWVFNVGGNLRANIQELNREFNYGGDLNVNRITDEWKITLRGRINEQRRTTIRRRQAEDSNGNPLFDENGNPILEDTERQFNVSDYSFNHQLVKSFSPKFSIGYDLGGSQNTRFNYEFQVSFRPGIEYNFFPESEQNSRFFRVNYGIEMRRNNYVDTTRSGQIAETVFLNSLRVSTGYTQRWGSIDIGYRIRNYLHNPQLWTTGLSIDANIRVTGNLSFNINLEGNYVKDQIYLSESSYSQEDILSGRVTLPSDYTFQTRFGFNYRFGSNLNNFVNRRFFGRANFVGND